MSAVKAFEYDSRDLVHTNIFLKQYLCVDNLEYIFLQNGKWILIKIYENDHMTSKEKVGIIICNTGLFIGDKNIKLPKECKKEVKQVKKYYRKKVRNKNILSKSI